MKACRRCAGCHLRNTVWVWKQVHIRLSEGRGQRGSQSGQAGTRHLTSLFSCHSFFAHSPGHYENGFSNCGIKLRILEIKGLCSMWRLSWHSCQWPETLLRKPQWSFLSRFCDKKGRHFSQPMELVSVFISFPAGCPLCGNVLSPTSCGDHRTGTVHAFLELIDPSAPEQQWAINVP